jgi:hypothetical protein
LIGINLPIKGIKGKNLTIKTFNPMGKEFYTDESKILSDNIIRKRTHNPNNLLNDHGEGTYVSAFYINEKFFGKVDFRLIDVESSDEDKRWRADSIKRGTFIGISVDLNNNGEWDSLSELLNKAKTEFIEGERITFVHRPKNYKDRANYGVKIYSEGKIIYSSEAEGATPSQVRFFHVRHSIPGEYTAIYELDGEVRDRRNFKIVPNKEGETKRRVIIDTLE